MPDLINPLYLLAIAVIVLILMNVGRFIRYIINGRDSRRAEDARILADFEASAMEHRGCHYCKSCQPAVTWSCRNKDAIRARGTNIPDVKECPWFEYDATKIEWED